MEKKDWNVLMDQVIVKTNLPGNSACTPKKKVQIMVCADFEDSSTPQEKFYHFTPVAIDDLPPFRLCHPRYWEEAQQNQPIFTDKKRTLQELEIQEVQENLSVLTR